MIQTGMATAGGTELDTEVHTVAWRQSDIQKACVESLGNCPMRTPVLFECAEPGLLLACSIEAVGF